MKKILVLALVVGLVASSLGAPALAKKKKKKKQPVRVERVVEFEYSCPCVGLFQLGGLTGTNVGGGPVATGAEDLYLSAVAEDASGRPIAVSFQQPTAASGGNEAMGEMCGETEDPIPVGSPGIDINIFVDGADPGCGGPSGLGGTITLTFSNVP